MYRLSKLRWPLFSEMQISGHFHDILDIFPVQFLLGHVRCLREMFMRRSGMIIYDNVQSIQKYVLSV